MLLGGTSKSNQSWCLLDLAGAAGRSFLMTPGQQVRGSLWSSFVSIGCF
jgi:hypothetical protein